MLFTHLSIAVTLPKPFHTPKTATNSASECTQARHLRRPHLSSPGPPGFPRSARRTPHAPSPQDTRPAAAHSSSKLHKPLPLAQPQLPAAPDSPRAAEGKRLGVCGGTRPTGPAAPLAGPKAAPAAGALGALGSPGASGGPGGRGCGRRGLLTRSWRSVVAGAPPGLRSRTRPRRASLPRDLARRGELGAHSSRRRRRRRCCSATLAAILTQPLSLPPGPAAAAKTAPAPAPPPSGGLGDRSLRWPSAAPTSAELPGLPRAWSPRLSPRPGGGGPLERRRGRGRAVPGRTQRAVIAHSGRGGRREPAGSRALGAFPGAWEREGPETPPRRGGTMAASSSGPGSGEGSQVPSAGSRRAARRPTQDSFQGCGCNSQRDFTDMPGDTDLSVMSFLNLKSPVGGARGSRDYEVRSLSLTLLEKSLDGSS